MSIAGTTPITAPVAPSSAADVYPSHIAEYGKGGYMSVANTTERDNITAARRTAGMRVYDRTTGIVYILGPSLTNGDWSVDNRGPQVVDNWATLAALNGSTIPNGTEFYARSKSTVGDGGQGNYYFDNSASATTVNGYIIAPGSGSGRFVRKLDNWIDVKRDFGAVGDGVTDDTTAIQNAITNCGDNTVYLPAGTYLVSTLAVKRGITIQGASNWNTIIKAKSGSTGWMVVADGSVSGSQQNSETNQVACTIRDIYFDGNSRQADYGCIYLNQIDQVLVENCFIWHFSRSGIYFNKSVRESVFHKVFIRFCGNQDATDNNGGGWPGFSIVDNESSGGPEDSHNGITIDSCQVVYCLGDHIKIDTRNIHNNRRTDNVLLVNNWVHGWSSSFTSLPYYTTINASATMKAYELVSVNCSFDVRMIGNRFSFAGNGKSCITLKTSTFGGSPVNDYTYNPEQVVIESNFFNGAWDYSTTSGRYAIQADAGSGYIQNNTVGDQLRGQVSYGTGFCQYNNPALTNDRGVIFDGSTASSYVSAPMLAIGSSDYTVHTRVRMPTTIPSSDAGIWSLSASVGGISVVGIGAYFSNAGLLYVQQYGATGSDYRLKRTAFEFLQSYLGQVVDMAWVRSGNTMSVYINGGTIYARELTGGSAPLWSDAPTTTYFNLGTFTSSQKWNSSILEARVANRALSASELQSLAARGTAYADRWATMTELASGSLTVGKRYRITARSTSDFTTAGASSNSVGTEFVATTTGPTLDASNKVLPIGWIVDLALDSTSTVAVDRSSNLLNASISGGVNPCRDNAATKFVDAQTNSTLDLVSYSTVTRLKMKTAANTIQIGPSFERTASQHRITLGDPNGAAAPSLGSVVGETGVGTDISGATLQIRPGLNTGAATGALLQFATGTQLASGTTAQTSTVRLQIGCGGQLLYTGLSADPTINDVGGGLYYNSVVDAFRQRRAIGWQTLGVRFTTNPPTDSLAEGDLNLENTQHNLYVRSSSLWHQASTPNKWGAITINTEVPTAGTTVTISIASPGVVSWTSHGLVAGQPISFTTTGSLPTGIVSGRTYYVSGTGLNTNDFQLAIYKGGSSLNTSGSQSGTHTASTYGAALTLLPTLRESTVVLTAPLTADRTVSVSTTGVGLGTLWRFTRTAASTGAFNWSIAGLKNLAVGTWCTIEYDGSAYVLTSYGAL